MKIYFAIEDLRKSKILHLPIVLQARSCLHLARVARWPGRRSWRWWSARRCTQRVATRWGIWLAGESSSIPVQINIESEHFSSFYVKKTTQKFKSGKQKTTTSFLQEKARGFFLKFFYLTLLLANKLNSGSSHSHFED